MIHRILIMLYGALLFPFPLHASFIEATMGTAVVNDATATFHNPAALTLVKKPQIVGLGSRAISHSRFTGQTIESLSGFEQSGTSTEQTRYTLPSVYTVIPVHENVRFGMALLSDNLSSDIDEPSILRYIQANNKIKNIDYVAGLGLQLNEIVSLGAGLTYSAAHFDSNRMTGFPQLNIPDSQSHNTTKDQQYGWNTGILLKPFQATLVGFDYRSKVSYQFSGNSEFAGPPPLISNQFNFNFYTPARSVLTLSHYINPSLGFISTVQRIQWSVFKTIVMHGLATQVGQTSQILPVVKVPYYFHDTWIFTVGGIKKMADNWVLRIAGSYSQSPGNGFYRIVNGDDYILGASVGYNINKNVTVDGGYAHSFVKDQFIDINSQNNKVFGITKGYRDSVSLKLTIKMLD